MLIAMESIKGLIQVCQRVKSGGNISATNLTIAGTPEEIRSGSKKPTTTSEIRTASKIPAILINFERVFRR